MLSTGTGTADAQAVNFVSKLLQNNIIHTDIAIKHIRKLLEFFKEFIISGFENSWVIAKQIPIGLKIEIKFKDHPP